MKTTEMQRGELQRLYWDEGLTLTAIGARFGVTRQGIAQLMQSRGIARRAPIVNPWRAVNKARAAFARARLDDPPYPPVSEWQPCTLPVGGDSITVMLPPRGPSGCRQNFERMALVVKALRGLRVARRGARAAP